MRVLTARRARTRFCPRRGDISRGLAYPSKLWWQGEKRGSEWVPNKDKRGFFCNVDWQMLVAEQSRNPNDPDLKKWADNAGGKFGSDIMGWPKIGGERGQKMCWKIAL